MKTTILFCDANLFLQCRPLHELDWRVVAHDAEWVRLLIPRAVQRELDRLKQDGSGRRSSRARNTNPLFREILANPENRVAVTESPILVTLEFAPVVQVALPEGCDSTKSDDMAIAEAVTFDSTKSEGQVIFLTHDLGAAATAKHVGLQFALIPDQWRLAPEPDERDKRIAQLEVRMRALEHDRPVIDIAGMGALAGSKVMEVEVVQYAPLAADVITRLMDEAGARFPLNAPGNDPVLAKRAGFKYEPPQQEVVEEYTNVEYPRWRESLGQFLAVVHKRLGWSSRVVNLQVDVDNRGNAPALNTVIEFELGPGLLFLPQQKDDEADEWRDPQVSAPQPPEVPTGNWVRDYGPYDSVMKAFGPGGFLGGASFLNRPMTSQFEHVLPEFKRNRHEFYWRGGRPSALDDKWTFECQEFRHLVSVESFDFEILIDPDVAGTSSGALAVLCTASNLPLPSRKQFPIVVRYVHGDTEAEAAKLLASMARTPNK